MLILGARINEEIVICLSEHVDPTLTVAELFAAGPLKIVPLRSHGSKYYDRVGIEAPDTLSIHRQARWIPPLYMGGADLTDS